jgi:hypothetical protein
MSDIRLSIDSSQKKEFELLRDTLNGIDKYSSSDVKFEGFNLSKEQTGIMFNVYNQIINTCSVVTDENWIKTILLANGAKEQELLKIERVTFDTLEEMKTANIEIFKIRPMDNYYFSVEMTEDSYNNWHYYLTNSKNEYQQISVNDIEDKKLFSRKEQFFKLNGVEAVQGDVFKANIDLYEKGFNDRDKMIYYGSANQSLLILMKDGKDLSTKNINEAIKDSLSNNTIDITKLSDIDISKETEIKYDIDLNQNSYLTII